MIFMLNKKSNALLIHICLMLLFSSVLISCDNGKDNVVNEDVLSLKASEEGRTKITILVKYAFTIDNFEKIVEAKFDDIDLVQVGDFSANTVLANAYKARLEHDDLTDIVITWPLDANNQYLKDRLIDLSGMPFTSNYKTSMLDSIASEGGELYYLPGPAQTRGIVYNKTMFAENGWEVPSNYDEFIALCKQIEATGMRAYQLSLNNQEVLDTAFMSANYGGYFAKPKDIAWLYEYNQGKGQFMDHFAGAMDTFQEMIDIGIYKEEDLQLTYADVQRNLYLRRTAMVEDSVQLLDMYDLYAKNSKDEFGIMPFFNKEPQSDWARIYMTCYIGLNQHLLEAENKDKYDKVIALMNFISSKEGQKALSSDSEGMYSSLKDMTIAKSDTLSLMVNAFEEGRYGVFEPLKRSSESMREGLAAMIRKEKSAQEVAAMIDAQNKGKVEKAKKEIYAKVDESFSLTQTGTLLATLLKEEANTDFGLFLDNGKDGKYNGKGVGSKIYKGAFTEVDLERIFPDLMHDESGTLWKVKIRGDALLEALENTMEVNGSRDWFYYVSGLKVRFNPEAKRGQRIVSLTLNNGDEIEKDKIYTVGVMDHCIDENLIVSYEDIGVSIKSLIRDGFKERKVLMPSNEENLLIVK